MGLAAQGSEAEVRTPESDAYVYGLMNRMDEHVEKKLSDAQEDDPRSRRMIALEAMLEVLEENEKRKQEGGRE